MVVVAVITCSLVFFNIVGSITEISECIIPNRSTDIEIRQTSVNDNPGPKYFTYAEIRNAAQARKDWRSLLYRKYQNELDSGATQGHQRFDFLGPVVPQCMHIETFGVGDDEKRACKLTELLRASPPSSCTIVSLGSNNQWGFEEAVFQNLSSCLIHTFDCTVPDDSQPPAQISARTTFHRICIGDRDFEKDGLIFMSWRSIMNLTNQTTAPLYLKMDIEGHEYTVLQSIIDSKFLIPMQIAVEFHFNGVPPFPRGKSSIELALFMEYLYQKGGYFLIDRHDNPLCSSCSEILLSQSTFLVKPTVQKQMREETEESILYGFNLEQPLHP